MVRLVHLCVAQLYAVYYTHPLVLLAIRVVLQITENLNKKISILINVVRGTPPNNHFTIQYPFDHPKNGFVYKKKQLSTLPPKNTSQNVF